MWNTVQNITSNGVVTTEDDLHLLDYNTSAVTITYTVTYTSPNAITPRITELQAAKPSTVNTAVSTLDVTFNEPINLGTFTVGNLSLALDGGSNLINSGVAIALVSGSTYQISGLAPLTAANGNYTLIVSASGVEDSLGDVGTGSVTTSWTMDLIDTNVTVENVTPALTNAAVTSITVVFSNPIDQPTFTSSDLSLTLNGGSNLITSGIGVTIANVDGSTYDVTLPSSLTTAAGAYDFSVSAAGILDANGNAVVGSDFTAWMMDPTAPVIIGLQQPQSPRNIVVPTVTVTFSKPVNPATFTSDSLSLTLTSGGVTSGNLLGGGVTITPDTDPLAPPNTFLISGINLPQSMQGTYTLTINNQYIADFAGNALSSPASVSWVLDLTAPEPPSGLAINPDQGPNPNDDDQSELTNSTTVTFSGTVDANTVEVRLEDLTTSTYLGDAFLSGQTFSRTLTLTPGLHALSAQAFDEAGNGSSTSTYDVFVDVVPSVVNSMAPINPNPATTPVDTETLVLNKTVKTFDWTALSLTLNGDAVALNSSVTVTPVSGASMPTYQIGGLAPFTAATGNYVLTVNANQIVDYASNTGSGSASVSWSEAEAIADVTITNTVDDATPYEGDAINFTVTVTDAGPANATDVSVLDELPSGLTLQSAAGDGRFDTSTGVWSISQINAGTSATLTLTASVNLGTGGETLETLASITSLDQIDNASPTSAEQGVTVQLHDATSLAISPDTGISSGDGVTDTSPVIFTGSLSDTGLTVDVFDTSTNQDLGDATVTGSSFSLALNLAEGSHVLRARASLNGVYADAYFTVLVDTTSPTSDVINALGATQSTDSFPVSISFSDPAGSGGAPASGVSSVDLYASVNNGAFSLYQTITLTTPTASGTVTFTFAGQDRNLYAFHSIAHDAAGNNETKNSDTIEASTSVPDLNPPVTHVLASSPLYSWSPFPSSEFSGLTPSSYSNGVFTLNWAGADPDQDSGVPDGYIALVNIYVEVDGGAPTLVGQLNGGTPNSNGVYTGSMTYNALGDGLSHTYSFYSIGVDDEQKAQMTPSSPDVTFSDITYTAPLAVQNFVIEDGIAERSFIQYLDVDFNQSLSTNPPSSALQGLESGLNSNPNSYVELLWYGENLNSGSTSAGSVNLFNKGTTAVVSLTGNDLDINFGANGITGLLTENNKKGTGSPTKTFGDGWYALGIDPTGNPQYGQVFWLTFFRLLGDTNGDGVVTGPYTTEGTDAYNVYNAIGETGKLLDADVNGDGAVNSKDLTETVSAKGDSVGTTAPANFPQFQLFAGAVGQAPRSWVAVPITRTQVQALLPEAIAGWEAAGLEAADVRRLEGVRIQVGDLGTSILGMEAANVITINQTAAGNAWYVNAGAGSTQAFDVSGPGGEHLAAPGSPAADEVDLLTVLEHELGHVIGMSDNNQAGNLMDITVGLGVRRSPTGQDLATIAGASSTTVPIGEKQGTSLDASVNRAAVDAALASLIGMGDGDRDDPDRPVKPSPPARSVRLDAGPGANPSRKTDRSSQVARPYPHRLTMSLFPYKNRSPGQPARRDRQPFARE